MFGNHGLGGLLEEGAHEKVPKCLDGNLGDFGGILQRSQAVNARSATDILTLHPNSAVLFYRKIRIVISNHLALAADAVFDSAVELDESYSGFIHHRINYSKAFSDRQNHIKGIENFCNQVKRGLCKYNGIARKSFPVLERMRISV